jgi:putative peptidoglycan lipid II flippase
MSSWMLAYVVTTQVAFLVTSRVASQVEKAPAAVAVGAGFSAYQYAWLLFQLPYAIVAISVITALLPRMSANAVNRRFDLVRADFSTGVRLGSVIVVPASLILAVLGPPIAQVLLSWGSNTENNAYFLGLLFSVFSLGLVPYMLFQLLLRVYYALHDSKTPALIGVVTMLVNVAANYLALALLPPADTILALAAGFGLANTAGVLIAWPSLSRRVGGLGGHLITRSLVRMHAAAIPAALFALTVALLIGTRDGATFLPDRVSAAVIVVVGGGGALLVYWLFAKATHLTELTDLLGSVRSRLGR